VDELETFRALRQMLEDRITHGKGSRIDCESGEVLFAETTLAGGIRVIAERSLFNPAEDFFEVEFGKRFVCH
jgi:hypothetical protein